MSMSAIPHLSRDGWLKDPASMVNKLFEYFLVSEYSQSNTFRGHIASLKYILEQNNTGADIKSEVIRALVTMYSKYFKDVLINVDVIGDDSSMLSLTIAVDVTLDGARYALDKNLGLSGGTVANMNALVADLYNY